ncbi:MAG TPA: histidine kinase [Lachnospiraceae bacterium]
MKTKEASIKKIIYHNFTILFVTTILVLILYSCLAYFFISRQTMETTNSALVVYHNSLKLEMNNIVSYQRNLIYNDTDFMLLSLSNLTEIEKISLENNTKKDLSLLVSSDECIFINSQHSKTSFFVTGSDFNNYDNYDMLTYKALLLKAFNEDKSMTYGLWNLTSYKNHEFLVYATHNKGIQIFSLIDLNKRSHIFAQENNSNLNLLFFMDDEKILTDKDIVTGYGISFSSIKNHNNRLFSKYFVSSIPVENTSISIAGIFSTGELLPYAKLTTGFILLFILLLLVFFILLLLRVNSFMVYPMEQLSLATNKLRESGNNTYISQTSTNIVEFRQIDRAISELVTLKNEMNDKVIKESFEKDRAVLQYFQLQTRSHFIINCLKSLNGMLETRDYSKMKRMIIAFSSHLRYIFHDNLQMVTLKEELCEVSDYFNIILLDRATPIILNKEVNEELLEYRVPSLLIQTFLENTIKYNKENQNLLIFDIKITKETLETGPVMQVLLGDNGIGYHPSILETLNSRNTNLYADKHVGIENLKHRIEILYRQGYDYAFYNSPLGGAKAVIRLPLIK